MQETLEHGTELFKEHSLPPAARKCISAMDAEVSKIVKYRLYSENQQCEREVCYFQTFGRGILRSSHGKLYFDLSRQQIAVHQNGADVTNNNQSAQGKV